MITALDIWLEEQFAHLKEDIKAMDELKHVGTPHEGATPHSGRYEYGSGEKPLQHVKDFLGRVRSMKLQGMKETEIAEGLGMNTRQLRAKISNAKIELRAAQRAAVIRMSEEGKTVTQIGKELDIPWNTVKRMLTPQYAEKERIRNSIADQLEEQVAQKKYLDIGAGTAQIMHVSDTKLKNTVDMLVEERGYKRNYIHVKQGGTNEDTTLIVLTREDVPWKEINDNKDKIRIVSDIYSEDGGRTFNHIEPPRAINSKRVQVAYAEDGGLEKDGLIEIRRGVEDISLGKADYAQVRIAVAKDSDDPNAGTHYMKGMAVYSDDLPEGIDIRYNSHRERGTPLWDNPDPMGETVFKKMKSDPENPFGATIKDDKTGELIRCQRHYIDADGKEQLSALNIVNEEGEWKQWSKTLSSQFLSKQSPSLAKKQLSQMYDQKESEFNDIMGLTNPTLKKELLESFADDCDASATHLKAASLPGTQSHVLIPLTDIRDDEIYAPNYPNGTKVVLIRHPHAGPFEIPELTVNNNVKQGKETIGTSAPDAVGISHKTAMKLSGADFDGDTALVIPNNERKVKSKPDNQMSKSLRELQDFDTCSAYPGYSGMEVITNKAKQLEMGKVSNLITDMTLMGATDDELARAVKYSMVIIDAEKHKLNYRQAYKDFDISGLTAKYHGVNERGQLKGAATIISRASSEIDVPKRKEGYLETDPVTGKKSRIFFDPKTGKKLYTETGETQVRRKTERVIDEETGKKVKVDVIGENGKPVYEETSKLRTQKSTRMAEEDDAYKLTSGGSRENPGTVMEGVYAEHANRLKQLARDARLAMLNEKDIQYNPSARKLYANEVASLDSKLRIAQASAPLERQAWLLAAKNIDIRLNERPEIKDDPDALKKLKGQALRNARIRVGSAKTRIEITDKEWKAIQSGAITKTKLKLIFRNTDMDKLKERAMPRTWKGMSSGRVANAKRMLKNGYSQAEVAEALGVSVSTLMRAIEG